jgi:alkanesulfonate monooxygenase SsuD/methylene tetrahydromethanopterin reductase-like flavin-dependent oxidoreductase (luciferase family)
MQLALFSVCSGRPGAEQRTLYDELLAQAELAERLGLAAFWIGEHHFSDWGTIRNTLLMLAALSQRTSRIRLGAGVVVLPLHHPVRVAEEAGMVDALSRGRLDLGVGRGARPHELGGYGVPYERRRELYEESLAILTALWASDRATFRGDRFSVEDLTVLPRPMQRPHPPIWEAVMDPDSVRIAAQRGHHLLVSARDVGYSAMADAVKLFKRTARDAGRLDARVAASAQVFLAPSDAVARDEGLTYLRQFFGEGSSATNDPLRPTPKALERFNAMSPEEIAENYAVETPDRLAERLRRLARATDDGVDLFLAVPQFGGQAQSVVIRTIELLAQEVAVAV